jgi:hypothetical protein
MCFERQTENQSAILEIMEDHLCQGSQNLLPHEVNFNVKRYNFQQPLQNHIKYCEFIEKMLNTHIPSSSISG